MTGTEIVERFKDNEERFDVFINNDTGTYTDRFGAQVPTLRSFLAQTDRIAPSSTSFSIGTGSKVFDIATPEKFTVGAYVLIVSSAAPTANQMHGQITALSDTQVTVNVTYTLGSGTHTDWILSLSSPRGPAGLDGGSSSSSTLAWSGTVTPTAPALTADTDDYNPSGWSTATLLRLSSDAVWRLNGLVANSIQWRVAILRNVGSFDIILPNAAVSSLSTSRFAFGKDLVLRAGGPDVFIQYDWTQLRWRLIAASLQEGFAQPETVMAAAATTNLGASTTEFVALTSGSGPISSFGSVPNITRWVRYGIAVTLTHGTALVLPNATNRNVKAGSYGFYHSDGSGNNREIAFYDPDTLTDLAQAKVDIAALQESVTAIPITGDDDTLDGDGSASVLRSVSGLEIERTAFDGSKYFPESECGAVPYVDGGVLKAIGGPYLIPTTILSSGMTSKLKNTGAPWVEVQGGFRAPYDIGISPFNSGIVQVGRIGNNVLVPDQGKTINIFFATGQSNLLGGALPLLRINYPFPNRLLMPKTNNPDDIRLYLNDDADEQISSANVLGFTSLKGGTHYRPQFNTNQFEVAMGTLAQLISESCGGWIPLLCGFVSTNSGNTVESMALGGGSGVTENVRTVIAKLVSVAAAAGYNVNVRARLIDQGEANINTATLADQWVAINAADNTYIKGLTGQANDVIPFITQTSSFSSTVGERSKTARYRASGDLIPVAPRYLIGAEAWTTNDYLHMTNIGHFRLGEAVGSALFQYFCQGGYTPLYPLTATVNNNSNIVTVTLPEAAAIDTSLVASFSQNGVLCQLSDNGTNNPITSVVPVGNTLVITLNANLVQGTSPTPFIKFGLTSQNGPKDAAGICRTNIRSVAKLPMPYSQYDGRANYKWMMHDALQITYNP